MSLVLTAALITPLGFHPHTDVELADWQASWSERMVAGETPQLIADWLSMDSRHPCQLTVCPEPQNGAVAARVPAAVTHPPSDGVEAWRTIVEAFWPPEHVDRMLRILECESHGLPTAVNPSSGAAGLFQIMPFWQSVWPGDYFDPWTNVAVAYQIWLTQGYGAWSCRG